MLDIKFIRENLAVVRKNTAERLIKVDFDNLMKLDEERRELLQKVEGLRAKKNEANELIKKTKEEGRRKKVIDDMKEVDQKEETAKVNLEQVEKEYLDLLKQVPNLTHPDAPQGKGEEDNKELRKFGEPTKFDFKPKDHLTLGKELDILDFDAGSKVTGSKFYFLKNEGVLLELALINYAFDILLKEGFTPVITPDLAKDEILEGIGFNPRGPETQVYSIENSDLSLVGTAEITLGGYHSGEAISEKDLPKKYVGLSHCFRTEAGSYGKFSQGLYRVHQFTKVEMFIYCLPEESEKMHELIVSLEEKITQGLGIPYRVVDTCIGELGGPAYRKYDLEAWLPSRSDYGEITSTSNCTDYQARRLNIKVKRENGKKEYLHMLNGTAIVSSRIPLAILENFQLSDGSVVVPKVLHPYMHGVKVIKVK